MPLNLYLLSQIENSGYDTYDSCVVAAENEKVAVRIHPSEYVWSDNLEAWCYTGLYRTGERVTMDWYSSWASHIKNVSCQRIGITQDEDGIEPGIILASFNAG